MILLSINREEYFITRMDVNLYRTGMNLSYLRKQRVMNNASTICHILEPFPIAATLLRVYDTSISLRLINRIDRRPSLSKPNPLPLSSSSTFSSNSRDKNVGQIFLNRINLQAGIKCNKLNRKKKKKIA